MRFTLSLLYAPIVFLILRYYETPLDQVLLLKAFPLVLSSIITLLMLVSYIKKKSMILYFAQKFSKHKISQEEKEYIHNSTLYWLGVSLINVILHLIIFLDTHTIFWVFYSSFGWYLLFSFAGIFQYLHRRFIFLKRLKDEA